MILAALLFIRKVTATTTVSEVTDDYVEAGRAHILQDKDIPEYVRVFRIHGPFLFGATDKLDMVSEQLDSLPPVVVVRLRNMTAIDATGLKVLEDLAASFGPGAAVLRGAAAASETHAAGRIRSARRSRKYLPEHRGSATESSRVHARDAGAHFVIATRQERLLPQLEQAQAFLKRSRLADWSNRRARPISSCPAIAHNGTQKECHPD
jgi:MFS superfamily sulfate permease-like transporter